jgi:5'-nucleotidase
VRILVTNDDGIHAPGLKSLKAIAHDLTDDVWVVAPETEQSGASHSLTVTEPLRLRQAGPREFALRGTPTDCVMMATKELMKDGAPDLVLSGVNRGANLADDVTYSGTIAGAMEGTMLGIRSIALSQSYGFERGEAVQWPTAERHGPIVIRRLLARGWPPNVLLNVNFPHRTPDEVAGVKLTEMGRRDQSELIVDKRTDPRGQAYYWLTFRRQWGKPADGTDLKAISEGYISVTPLHLDLTHRAALEHLASAFDGA